jgi:hypothetical protein
MQLVAYGAQDVFLTGTPKVTFFQAVYKRHTNFAMETIEQTLNGNAANSGRLSVTVARNGDLVGDMYCEMTTLATLKPVAGDVSKTSSCWVAERAIKDIELSIGGQRIDKHYQMWWRLYSELYLDASKKAQWGKMTSSTLPAAAGKVYLPLLFFFNRNAGLYLPLIALQYHEVRLDFDLAGDYESYLSTTGFKVWANYVYLDTEERRRFAQKGHEYLIEQVQHTGTDSVESGNTKQVRLSYNHPVKELVWCFNGGSNAHSQWNFTAGAEQSNAVVLCCDPQYAVGREDSNAACLVPTTFVGAPALVVGGHLAAGATRSPVSDLSWSEEGAVDRSAATEGAGRAVGPLSSFKLVLNGQDRFKEQDGKYFNQVQPMQYHTGCPYPGVYSYSFALKPEEHQPSGSCNFSRIDNAQVAVTLKADTANNQTMHMFATSYNVLRIQSGMGGLAFSN